MKQDNSTLTTREKALEWWGGLTIQRQTFMAAQHKPEWHFEMVASSSSTIERMYLSQHSEQSLPEETIKEQINNRGEGDIMEENRELKKAISYSEKVAYSTSKDNAKLLEENTRLKERIEELEYALRGLLTTFGHSYTELGKAAYYKAKEALNNK